MVEFSVPALTQNIRDLELANSSDNEKLRAENVTNVGQMNAKEQEAFVSSAVSEMEQSNNLCRLVCENQDWFDKVYSIVRYFQEMSIASKVQTIQLLCSLLKRVIKEIENLEQGPSDNEAIAERTSLKVATYLLAKTCIEEEKTFASNMETTVASTTNKRGGNKKSKSKAASSKTNVTYDWNVEREIVVETILLAIKSKYLRKEEQGDAKEGQSDDDDDVQGVDTGEYLDFGKLWKCGLPEESFLDLFWRVSETLVLENPKLASVSCKLTETLQDLVCAPVFKFHATIGHLVTASFSHSMRKHDNMPIFIAGILERLNKFYKDDRLAREIILEIGRMESSEQTRDANGAKLLGALIENIASVVPALTLSNLSVLLLHLGAHAYPLRCSVTRALGHLVAYFKIATASSTENEEQQADQESTRDRLLDLIGERTHDTSSYVRAVAVGVFADLAANACLPLSHIHVACDFASERILDKSSLVRKQAIACLTSLLESNPYSSQLDASLFKEKILELEAKLPKDTNDQGDDDAADDDDDEEEEEDANTDTVKEEKSKKGEGEGEEDDEKKDEDEDESMKEKKTVDPAIVAALTYYKSAFGFTIRLEHACSQAEQLICSKSVTDVLESMRFLSSALRFKIPAAKESMRKMLSLIWDDRESGRVKKELLETFELIFISEPVQVGRSTKRKLYATETIARNLIDMVLGATLAEITSLEKIIADLVTDDNCLKRLVIPTKVIESIWKQACSKNSDDIDGACNIERQRGAMCLVAMTTCSTNTLFQRKPEHVKILVEKVLAETRDYQIAQYAFTTLQRVVVKRDDTSKMKTKQENHKALEDRIESIVTGLVVGNWSEDGNNEDKWYPAAEQGIKLLMTSNRPDLRFARLIRKLHKRIFGLDSSVTEGSLARLFFLVGQISIHLFVYAEATCSKAKRLRKGQEEASNSKKSKNQREKDEELEILGGGGADTTGEDYEEMVLKRIAEMELVSDPSQSLLGYYVPMMAQVVERGLAQDSEVEQGLANDVCVGARLMESATLGLCKVMCLSNEICEKYLRMVFTVLRDSRNASVRSNIMIALGDLAVRFPNTIEPFTSQVYRRLRDPDQGVRKTSLMVLSHLILNDMIKVRGEVFEIALCVEDQENERIRDLACLFFHELARKGNNPVYNLFPDTINKLSQDPMVDQSKFEKLAKFLLQFITLEKHIQGLTDKLCQRIFAATGLTVGVEEVENLDSIKDLELCQNLAFCLSQLKTSEKAVQKLADPLFKLYKPVLSDDRVYNSIQTVIKRAKQNGFASKQENKQLLDDWVLKIEQVRESHLSNQKTTKNAKRVKGKGRKRAGLGVNRRAKEAPAVEIRKTRSRATTRSSNKENTKIYEEEEEEEEQEQEFLLN